MWLLHTTTYTFRQVHSAVEKHPYAILSHTWDESEDDPLRREVDFQTIHNLARARMMTGWTKIQRTCGLARDVELQWAWIDTCCIDKSSSVELSEAINSMFRWYREATVCFVWLSDLPRDVDGKTKSQMEVLKCAFRKCRWFTRGWTLQELIAPSKVEFYDEGWTLRTTKASFEYGIEAVTGVDVMVLRDSEMLASVPVARRMSWASRRTTKRREDMAYSLLGIFGVNMPLTYGEGDKAFLRLQELIVQEIHDWTLFAWSTEEDAEAPSQKVQVHHGLFADSPRDFSRSEGMAQIYSSYIDDIYTFSLTFEGLQFETIVDRARPQHCYMSLQCQNKSDPWHKQIAIAVVKTPTGFARVQSDFLFQKHISEKEWISQIYTQTIKLVIPKHISSFESQRLEARLQHAFVFLKACPTTMTLRLYPSRHNSEADARDPSRDRCTNRWDPINETFLTGGIDDFRGTLSLFISNKSQPLSSELIWPTSIKLFCRIYHYEPPREIGGNVVSTKPWIHLVPDTEHPPGFDGNLLGDAILQPLVRPDTRENAENVLRAHLERVNFESLYEPGYRTLKSAVLTPWQRKSGTNEKIRRPDLQHKFSVTLQTTVVDGHTEQEVRISLVPWRVDSTTEERS